MPEIQWLVYSGGVHYLIRSIFILLLKDHLWWRNWGLFRLVFYNSKFRSLKIHTLLFRPLHSYILLVNILDLSGHEVKVHGKTFEGGEIPQTSHIYPKQV